LELAAPNLPPRAPSRPGGGTGARLVDRCASLEREAIPLLLSDWLGGGEGNPAAPRNPGRSSCAGPLDVAEGAGGVVMGGRFGQKLAMIRDLACMERGGSAVIRGRKIGWRGLGTRANLGFHVGCTWPSGGLFRAGRNVEALPGARWSSSSQRAVPEKIRLSALGKLLAGDERAFVLRAECLGLTLRKLGKSK